MNTSDIRNGLKDRLYNAGVAPSGGPWPTINWPNVETTFGEVPRLEVMTETVSREGGTLKGGEVLRELGLMSVSVCVPRGAGEDAAFVLVQDVLALFPEGTRFAVAGGNVVIPAPPNVGPGYPDSDGTCYRVAVSIRYSATAT